MRYRSVAVCLLTSKFARSVDPVNFFSLNLPFICNTENNDRRKLRLPHNNFHRMWDYCEFARLCAVQKWLMRTPFRTGRLFRIVDCLSFLRIRFLFVFNRSISYYFFNMRKRRQTNGNYVNIWAETNAYMKHLDIDAFFFRWSMAVFHCGN